MKSWIEAHRHSEGLAASAEAAKRNGDHKGAERLYVMAAEAEELALRLVPRDKFKTYGVTAVSAVALFYKGQRSEVAEQVAMACLANENLPDFARHQLKSVVQTIWGEQSLKLSGVEFVKGEVLVSVAGGLVTVGAAPLELVRRKVEEIKNIYYRTVEMLLGLPVRIHGSPPDQVVDNFRPWIIQAAPGSYQFGIRMERPSQLEIFTDSGPQVQEVTDKVLRIIEASSSGNMANFERAIPSPDYREIFLKQMRNLAPTGTAFESLTIRSSIASDIPPAIFSPESRKGLNSRLKARTSPEATFAEDKTEQIEGVLRGLQLNNDWIEITLNDGETVRIFETGDAVDDIIGPMVNHRVLVDVKFKADGKRIYRDIQSRD